MVSRPTIGHRDFLGFDGLVIAFTIHAKFSVATFAVADIGMLSPAHALRRERVHQLSGGDRDGFRSAKNPMPRIPGTASIRLQSQDEICAAQALSVSAPAMVEPL
ncbi:hypothetical protein I6F21_27255 [Bradyrhizobium sp. NBAIM03]|uniref:hypothetical protein n=1 Tax=unclassified Bradyrhizobium TaxID=2631580 RepID=UPI001CD27F74|nr:MULTISPECIES: hypothetical protein [unclassified Bradyrhizobium]MCA1471017.1 hypothetical protein [Bradyrhizobium sp. IC3195]MCA1536232.1 hypothetical protein [Bradyrhizobium sp. NBAIM03]